MTSFDFANWRNNRFLLQTSFAVALLLMQTFSTTAQEIGECAAESNRAQYLNSFSKPSKKISKFFNDTSSVSGQTKLVIQLYSSPDVNLAVAINNFRGSGPAIIYNKSYLEALRKRNKSAALGVIAHEFGHFASKSGRDCNVFARELSADRFAGCVFARLKKTKTQATAYIVHGLPQLPQAQRYAVAKKLRKRAIHAGFDSCVT